MATLNSGDRLVVASHNPGKVREIQHLIEPFGLDAVSASELDIPEPVEDGTTFAANASIKARACAEHSGLPALSDDSGLEVHALDGAPGLYSARWGGPDKDFNLAMERVNRELEDKDAITPEQRRANFICALCLAFPGGEDHVYEGRVFGHIICPMRGDNGFGYDPIFMPDGYEISFGEMEPAKKHAMSHRANAFKLFIDEQFRK